MLEEAAALANPLTFSLPDNQTIKNAAVGKALQNLKEHALAVFPPDEAKNIFAQLGTVKASSSLMAKKACGCSTIDTWNCSNNYCRDHAYNGCSTSSWGCGTIWLQECNGDC